LRRVQDFVGIRVADAAEEVGIGESALERVVFAGEHRAECVEIAGEDIDASGVKGMQAVLTEQDVH
jgi:hypothetical protein